MKRTIQRARDVVAATALVIAVASCGGSSNGQADTPSVTPAASDAPAATDLPAPSDAPAASDLPTASDAPAATDPPAAAERIVALDETAAISLLTLGIEPTIVLTTLSSDMFVPIAEALGIDTAPFSISEPALEYLASLEADRIVALSNPFLLGRLDDFEAIAPVTLVPVDGTWQEQLTTLATEFDATARADHLISTVEASLDDLEDELLDTGVAGSSVSVLTAQGDMVIAATGTSPAGSVLSALGFTRPPAQDAGSRGLPYVPLTLETLNEHDADMLVLPTGSLFGEEVITSSPLYPTLDAVKNDRVAVVSAESWIVGGSAFATWWIANDLRSIFISGSAPATAADAADLWQQFTELTR